jgi:hypothetical protein
VKQILTSARKRANIQPSADSGRGLSGMEVVGAGAGSDRPVTSQASPVAHFPDVLHMLLGDWTEEYGPPQSCNKMCCLVTEAARSSPDLKAVFHGKTPNGKSVCFTGSGLTITLDRHRARYVFKDDSVLYDVVRFDDGLLAADGRHKRRVQAFLVSVEEIPKNSDDRREQINKARRERKRLGRLVVKRDRMVVVRRHLRQRGYEV